MALLMGLAQGCFQTQNAAAAQVYGTTFTSHTFGYAISWQMPWYLVEEDSDAPGYDTLRIADSQSEVLFLGGKLGVGGAASILQEFVQRMKSRAEYSNFRSVAEPSCVSPQAAEKIASACFRFDFTDRDGSTTPLGIYFKGWAFVDGVTVLMQAMVDESLLTSYVPHWNNIGVYELGAELLALDNGCLNGAHHDVEFCFDPVLTERDQSDMVEGVLLGQSVMAKILGDEFTETVAITGLGSVSPWGGSLLATTRGSAIAVYGGSEVWRSISPIERIETLVHEYFHVFQNSVENVSQSSVPLWFTEGSAESFGFTVVSEIGVTNVEEFYSLALYKMTRDPVTSDLKTIGANGSMQPNEYALAYLAIQHLLASHGKTIVEIVHVYQDMGEGYSFDEAFTLEFGTTLEQFYRDFEVLRDRLSDVYVLDDDFYLNVPDGEIAQTEFRWITYPQGKDHRSQLVFVGQTEPLEDCLMELWVSGQFTRRETWANGQGQIFWLISLPEYVQPGVGHVSVTCGQIPHSSVISFK